jgi:hypothetical protein
LATIRQIDDCTAKEVGLLPSVAALNLSKSSPPFKTSWALYYRQLIGSFDRLRELSIHWHWDNQCNLLPSSGLVKISVQGSTSDPAMKDWLQLHKETLKTLQLLPVSW